MSTIKEALHEKRKLTEDHIRQLEREGKQGVRYTAMMPDVPFLVLGLLSDVGWLTHLVAGAVYFCRNGIHHRAAEKSQLRRHRFRGTGWGSDRSCPDRDRRRIAGAHLPYPRRHSEFRHSAANLSLVQKRDRLRGGVIFNRNAEQRK